MCLSDQLLEMEASFEEEAKQMIKTTDVLEEMNTCGIEVTLNIQNAFTYH